MQTKTFEQELNEILIALDSSYSKPGISWPVQKRDVAMIEIKALIKSRLPKPTKVHGLDQWLAGHEACLRLVNVALGLESGEQNGS